MAERVFVAGVGMTPFVKPGASAPYTRLGADAVRDALADAGIGYADVQQAFVGYVYGDSTSGQAALYEVGLSGIPIINVNNNCATGSSALFLANQAVASGMADCVLALGFEQMAPGAIQEAYTDRPTPLARFLEVVDDLPGAAGLPLAIKLFGGAGIEYQQRYGANDETFACITAKARRHARHNARAIFRSPLTVDEVLASPRMFGPITRLQCCPPTCGGAAAVLVSERFARRHGIDTPVAIRAQAMTTDFASSFEAHSPIKAVGYDLARAAADRVYAAAGVGPADLDVVELHDCFTANEILSYEALRLTGEGDAARFIADGDNTYGGRVVTNPSGGLLSKGHPLGATGLAQCAELSWQLRGQAGPRQVEGARLALQHNLGLGGACVVTLYERI
ncbi:lipid-transfer protein [Sphingosinicella microcystinivorans]|uniref:lipid-transfer protein n=1 Tax=Sphingosinicella microcystinivorans TaxID=335406 RepID=UPI0022F3B3FA|nr:lipid-transfer protein [Sphingosinicella microcystinivorans]WBX85171.1 lipid-transfer protein [Sphingosinicella microcystinivorans]